VDLVVTFIVTAVINKVAGAIANLLRSDVFDSNIVTVIVPTAGGFLEGNKTDSPDQVVTFTSSRFKGKYDLTLDGKLS
jgi:hypothetical protein